MNQKAIQDAYNLFTESGYKKSIDDFKSLIKTNPNALNDSYELFKGKGYSKDIESYKSLVGVSEKKSSVSTGTTPQKASSTPLRGQSTTLGGKDKEKPKPLVSSGGAKPKATTPKITSKEKAEFDEAFKSKPTTPPMGVIGADFANDPYKGQRDKSGNIIPGRQIDKSILKLVEDKKSAISGVESDVAIKQSEGILPPNSLLIETGDKILPIYDEQPEFLKVKSFDETLQEQINPLKTSVKKPKVNYENLKKSRDLELKNPYLYFSKSKEGDTDVDNFYTNKINNLPINKDDFDGFLRKNGYLSDVKKDVESGLYDKDRGVFSENYNEELIKEKRLVDYLSLYIDDKNQRDYDLRVINYKQENPNATEKDIEKNVSKYTFVSDNDLEKYIEETFPIYTKNLKERKNKEKEEWEDTKENKGNFFSWQTVKKIGAGFQETIGNRISQLTSTIYETIGMEDISKQIRFSAEEDAFNRPENRDISYVSGKKVSYNGSDYLIDSEGQVYDYDLKKRVTDLFTKNEYDSIVESSKKGEDDNLFSWVGATVQTTNVIADLGLQIALTRGFSGASGLAVRGLSKEGLAVLSKMPVSNSMASSAAAQTFLGYSQGLEDTLVAAKNAGIPDSEAKAIANDAAIKTAALYLFTSGISPQTKASFMAAKDNLIKEAIDVYAKKGKSSYIKFLNNGINNLTTFLKEGGKETGQEVVQTAGTVYGINPSINEAAGKDIVQREMTADQIISMIPSTFVAGFSPIMLRNIGGIFSRKDYLSNLDVASNNVDLSNKRLDELLSQEVITKVEHSQSKEDLRVYSQNKSKIPKDTSSDIVLDVAKKLDEISKLESEKKNLDQAFHEKIDQDINSKRTEIKDLYEKQSKKDLVLNTLSSSELLKIKDQASRELLKEANERGETDIKITDEQITERAIENYEKQRKETTAKEPIEKRPTGEQKVEAATTAEGQQDKVLQEAKDNVEVLRKEEIAEFEKEIENPQDFITDGKVDAKKVEESDNAKAKEIYAKYDAQIKPLLDNIKTQEDAIQKQSTDEGVLRPRQPEVGLQEVVEGDQKPEDITEEGKEEIVPGSKAVVSGIEITYPTAEQETERKEARSKTEYVEEASKDLDVEDTTVMSKELEGDFGILTAENPMAKPLTEAENVSLNKKAKQWLESRGYKPRRLTGKYAQAENSFFVPNLSKADAVAFAKEFNQDSVAHSEGLIYQDGSMNPRVESDDDFTFSKVYDANSDNVSVVRTKDGLKTFSVGYNFNERVQPKKAESKGREVSKNTDQAKTQLSNVADKRIAKAVFNGVKAIAKILPNVKVIIHDTDESFRSVSGEAKNQESSGLYQNGEIHINLPKANARTVAHEIFHAILLDKVKTDANAQVVTKKMIQAIASKIEGNPALKAKLEDFASMYDENIQNEEKLAELVGMLAENYDSFSARVKEIIKNWLNNLAKTFGVELFETNEVFDVLNTIAKRVAAGKEIKEKQVVNFFKENVDVKISETKRKQANDAFNGAIEKLGIKLGTTNEKTGKTKVTNYDVASALNEYYSKKHQNISITDFSKNTSDIVSDYAKNEILFAISTFGKDSGKGWYTEDYNSALNILSSLDGDILKNKNIKEIATAIIALASNSTDVYTNLTRVIYGINKFKLDGTVPNDVGVGKGASAISSGIDRYNNILLKFDKNPTKVAGFLQQIDTISNLKKKLISEFGLNSYAQALNNNLATDPDWNDNETLPMSVLIFGPKIGAFYSNLSGLDGTPTIDRWCIRTIYRYRGDMRSKVSEKEMEDFKSANGIENVSYSEAISLAQEHSKLFDAILTGRGIYKGMPKEERNLKLKPYRKGSQIWKKAQGVVNDISEGIESGVSNKKQYAKDFRSFTKTAFESARDKVFNESGIKLSVSDVQAILWIYEKNLFGHLGVKQREDSTYSAAAKTLTNKINSGEIPFDKVISGDRSILSQSDINTDGAMGDIYGSTVSSFENGLENSKKRNTENIDSIKPAKRQQKVLPVKVAEKLTEDGDGNFVFKHYSDERRDVIKKGQGQNRITSTEESSALSSVGGLAMFYTMANQAEAGVGNVEHTVLIPKDKVYDIDSDPLGFEAEARKRFNEVRPGQAFTNNYRGAFITKIANENGFDIAISQWRGAELRAQTTIELKPETTNTEFKERPLDTFKDGDYAIIDGRESIITNVDGDRLRYESIDGVAKGTTVNNEKNRRRIIKIDNPSVRMQKPKKLSAQIEKNKELKSEISDLKKQFNDVISAIKTERNITKKEVLQKQADRLNKKISDLREKSKAEVSELKEQMNDLFSSAKEAIKIQTDKAKTIKGIKKQISDFIKDNLSNVDPKDINKTQQKSLLNALVSVNDENFEEVLGDVLNVFDAIDSKKENATNKAYDSIINKIIKPSFYTSGKEGKVTKTKITDRYKVKIKEAVDKFSKIKNPTIKQKEEFINKMSQLKASGIQDRKSIDDSIKDNRERKASRAAIDLLKKNKSVLPETKIDTTNDLEIEDAFSLGGVILDGILYPNTKVGISKFKEAAGKGIVRITPYKAFKAVRTGKQLSIKQRVKRFFRTSSLKNFGLASFYVSLKSDKESDDFIEKNFDGPIRQLSTNRLKVSAMFTANRNKFLLGVGVNLKKSKSQLVQYFRGKWDIDIKNRFSGRKVGGLFSFTNHHNMFELNGEKVGYADVISDFNSRISNETNQLLAEKIIIEKEKFEAKYKAFEGLRDQHIVDLFNMIRQPDGLAKFLNNYSEDVALMVANYVNSNPELRKMADKAIDLYKPVALQMNPVLDKLGYDTFNDKKYSKKEDEIAVINNSNLSQEEKSNRIEKIEKEFRILNTIYPEGLPELVPYYPISAETEVSTSDDAKFFEDGATNDYSLVFPNLITRKSGGSLVFGKMGLLDRYERITEDAVSFIAGHEIMGLSQELFTGTNGSILKDNLGENFVSQAKSEVLNVVKNKSTGESVFDVVKTYPLLKYVYRVSGLQTAGELLINFKSASFQIAGVLVTYAKTPSALKLIPNLLTTKNGRETLRKAYNILNTSVELQDRINHKKDNAEVKILESIDKNNNTNLSFATALVSDSMVLTTLSDYLSIVLATPIYIKKANDYMKNNAGVSESEALLTALPSFFADEVNTTLQSNDSYYMGSNFKSGMALLLGLGKFVQAPRQIALLSVKEIADAYNRRKSVADASGKVLVYSIGGIVMFKLLADRMFGDDDDEEKLSEADKETKMLKETNEAINSLLVASGLYGEVLVSVKDAYLTNERPEILGFTKPKADLAGLDYFNIVTKNSLKNISIPLRNLDAVLDNREVYSTTDQALAALQFGTGTPLFKLKKQSDYFTALAKQELTFREYWMFLSNQYKITDFKKIEKEMERHSKILELSYRRYSDPKNKILNDNFLNDDERKAMSGMSNEEKVFFLENVRMNKIAEDFTLKYQEQMNMLKENKNVSKYYDVRKARFEENMTEEVYKLIENKVKYLSGGLSEKDALLINKEVRDNVLKSKDEFKQKEDLSEPEIESVLESIAKKVDKRVESDYLDTSAKMLQEFTSGKKKARAIYNLYKFAKEKNVENRYLEIISEELDDKTLGELDRIIKEEGL